MTPAPAPGVLLDASAIAEHLRLLGKDPALTRFRAFPHKNNPNKRQIGARKAQGLNLATFTQWQREGRGLYAVINDGGDKKDQISACRAFWLEWDDRPVAWQLTAWQSLGLPEPTFIVATGGRSLHLYWVLETPIDSDQWEPIQAALLHHAQADPNVKDCSRVLRLAGSAYIDAQGRPQDRVTIVRAAGARYTVDTIAAALAAASASAEPEPAPAAPQRPRIALDDARPAGFTPHSLDEIRQALGHIPPRTSGSYEFHRNVLWGLIAAVQDVGGTIEQAIGLMEAHSPSATNGWDVEQVARSGNGSVTAGTFWHHARAAGFRGSAGASRAAAGPHGPGSSATDDPAEPDPERPSRPPSEVIAELLETLLDLQTSTGDTWAKEHAIRADLWRLGVPASAIDERTYYALAKRWNLPLQASHDGGRRGRSIADPLDSQAVDLVPGFLLWQRDHVLFGAGGSGKTMAAAALAVCCIKGQPFLDQEIPPSITGKVLWIGTDGGEGARAMVREYLEDLGVADDPEVVAGLNIWTAEASQGIPSWAATPSGLQELKDELETGGYALVVIDSLKAVLELAGVNFSIGPVGTLMRLLQALVGRHCSLLWLHHPAGGKAAGKGLTAAAGSQNINQIPSAVHQITRQTTDRGPLNAWSVHKLRGAPSREFTYRLAEEGFQLVDGQVTKNVRAALLDSIDLRSRQGITTATTYLHQEMPQQNESTIRNNLTWLRKRGLIRKAGRLWELTHQGQKLLRLSVEGLDLNHWLSGTNPLP